MTENKAQATAAPGQQGKKKKEEPDPKLIEASKHFQAGNAAYAEKDMEKAEAAYLKAIEIKDDFRDALFNLGVLYRDHNRFEEAKPMFQKIVASQPRAANAKNNRMLPSSTL